jgi:hypothetical protein
VRNGRMPYKPTVHGTRVFAQRALNNWSFFFFFVDMHYVPVEDLFSIKTRSALFAGERFNIFMNAAKMFR